MRTPQEHHAAEYARQIHMPVRTVLSYFEAHGLADLPDIQKAFPNAGRVALDMQTAITEWVLTQ